MKITRPMNSVQGKVVGWVEYFWHVVAQDYLLRNKVCFSPKYEGIKGVNEQRNEIWKNERTAATTMWYSEPWGLNPYIWAMWLSLSTEVFWLKTTGDCLEVKFTCRGAVILVGETGWEDLDVLVCEAGLEVVYVLGQPHSANREHASVSCVRLNTY